MYFYNYRFRLPDEIQFPDPEEAAQRIEHMLNNLQGIGLTRTALDFTSPNKSISLLCKSKNAQAIESAVTQILWKENITLCNEMEEEALWFEEEVAHNDQIPLVKPMYTGGVKKKRKKNAA